MEFLVDREIDWRFHYQSGTAYPFDKFGSQILTQASTIFVDLISFVIPVGVQGAVKWVGQGADNVLAFNRFSWTLWMDGTPVFDWENVTIQRGTLSLPDPVTFPVRSSTLIQLRVKAVAAGGYSNTLYGRLKGWYWPE